MSDETRQVIYARGTTDWTVLSTLLFPDGSLLLASVSLSRDKTERKKKKKTEKKKVNLLLGGSTTSQPERGR